MNILIVGNVLKDVYLNLDTRTEHFEADASGTPWLDISFDTSHHHYFRRNSSFGGAAVSLEVLTKLGIPATINCSDFSFEDTGVAKSSPADAYRYILTAGDNVSYLTPTLFQHTDFVAPDVAPDYIYIDRSANPDQLSVNKIRAYLDAHPSVGLVLHLKNTLNLPKNSLLPYANLVFTEAYGSPELAAVDQDKIIYLAEDALTYKNITEPISVDRIDTLTHLSAFCIAATTVLGGFLLGRTVEESLSLARAQVENATLNSCLTLKELESLAAISSDSPELLAAAYMSSARGIPASLVLPAQKSFRHLHSFYQSGYRFFTIDGTLTSDVNELSRGAALSLAADLVPIITISAPTMGHISITRAASATGDFLKSLFAALKDKDINLSSVILSLSFVTETPDYPDPSTVLDVAAATSEVIRRHVPSQIAGVTLFANSTWEQKATPIINEMKRSGSYGFPISLPPELLQA